jgi:hypothetical protein
VLFKRRKVSLKIILSLVLLIALSFINISKDNFFKIEKTGVFDIAKDDLIQQILSLDLGFSSMRNLVDIGYPLHDVPTTAKVKKLFFNLPDILPGVIRYKFSNKNEIMIEKIIINIDFLEYQKLLSSRELAIKNGSLKSFSSVKAKILYGGQEYKAEIRLKGDLSGHWRSHRRMSLRVNLKGDGSILGFSKFSLHKPRERQYPYDKVFQKLMKDTGNLSSSSKIAKIYVNGDNWGVMDIEGHITKEFIEKQNRKESLVVKFSDGSPPPFPSEDLFSYDMYRLSDPSYNVHVYGEKSSLKDYQKRKLYSYILSKNIRNKDLFDFDSLSKAYILSAIWGSPHTLVDRNARFYLNPYTLKLEIITTDQTFWQEILPLSDFINSNDVRLANFLSYKSFQNSIVNNLDTVVNVIPNIEKYLNTEHQLFPVDQVKKPTIIFDNVKKLLSNKDSFFKENNLEVSKNLFDKPTYKQANKFTDHLHVRHFVNGNLEIYNLLPYDVELKDISYDGKVFNDSNIIIPSYLSKFEKTIIKTPYIGIHDYMINLTSEYEGFIRNNKSGITLVSEGVFNPLLVDTADNFDFLIKKSNNSYEIKKGNWIINSPMIINGDLKLQPGVHLKFTNESYLIINGAITAIGDSSNSISLSSLNDSWKGMYVLNSNRKSHLANLSMSNISALESGVLKLTGAVSFYKSNVDLNNVQLDNIFAEDAINIIESSFSLRSIKIINSISDGVDSDYSNGVIESSDFLDIGGDALDFSGSNVSINQVKIINVKDKAVSAGENSLVKINNSLFKNIGVGVASKDGSNTFIANTSISDYKLYGAMSYVKKDFYSKPSLIVNDCILDQKKPFFREKGTILTVDNLAFPEKDINIEALYNYGVMAK